MAALSAMDYGRRFMWALHYVAQDAVGPSVQGVEPRLRQLTLFEAWGVEAPASQAELPEAPATPVQRACRAAVADFWSRLQSFVSLHAANAAVLPAVSATHPFIARQDGRLIINQPVPPA
jgi:hypothetical protein